MEAILKYGSALQYWLLKLSGSTPVIIVFALLICATCMFTPGFYAMLFGEPNTKQFNFIFFLTGMSVLTFAIAPLLANKFILQQTPAAIGLQRPQQPRRALTLTLIGLAYGIPVILFLVNAANVSAYYTFRPCGLPTFLFMLLVIFPVFYLAEELFFRGFLFLTLYEKIGWHSYWVTDYIFTVAHIGKPPLEILLCIPASILLNYITLNSRSIMPAFVVHTCMGILAFSLVNYRLIVW